MKKFILILTLIGFATFSMAQDKTGRIPTGFTGLDKAFVFTAADSVAGHGGSFIVESDSLVLYVTNPQKFMQHQTFTTTLEAHSGTPAVTVTLRGKVTSTDSWHPIGSPVSWSSSANNPGIITSTVPYNYNYLKISYVTDATDQCVRVLTADLKTSNAFEVPTSAGTITFSRPTSGTVTLTAKDNDANAALTIKSGGTGALTLGQSTGATSITGSAVNVNASLNIATNINTGTSTGALSLGGGSGTVAVNSSVWDVTTAGVVTGFKSVTTTADADNVVIDPYKDLHVVDVQVNSSSKFSVDSTGNIVAAGSLTAGSLIGSGALIVGQDTCKGSQTKAVGSLGMLKVTAACTLKGFTGGVTGQKLVIVNSSATTLALKHNGAGTQKIMISGGSDLSLTGQYNSVTLAFDGTVWYVTGKGQ